MIRRMLRFLGRGEQRDKHDDAAQQRRPQITNGWVNSNPDRGHVLFLTKWWSELPPFRPDTSGIYLYLDDIAIQAGPFSPQCSLRA